MFKLGLNLLLIIVFFIFLAKLRAQKNKEEKIVYIGNKSKKYHLHNCPFILDIGKPINIYIAIKKGYQPCKTCKPNDNKKKKSC